MIDGPEGKRVLSIELAQPPLTVAEMLANAALVETLHATGSAVAPHILNPRVVPVSVIARNTQLLHGAAVSGL